MDIVKQQAGLGKEDESLLGMQVGSGSSSIMSYVLIIFLIISLMVVTFLAANNNGVDPDELDELEFGGDIIEGDNQEYLDLINFVENNNMIGTAFIEYEPYNITEDVKFLYIIEKTVNFY